MKRIGVLTSGGDCAGLNAILRAIILRGGPHFELIGIENGTLGLMSDPITIRPLTPQVCSIPLLQQGGTLLFSNTKHVANDADIKRFIDNYHHLGLEALIAIGGDGSLRILYDLAQQGAINLVAIPKTIDNDVCHTDLAIGHSTAVDVVTAAIDRLQSTAMSHQRLMIVEVMGRDAGHIALNAGIASGADMILMPEIPYDLNKVCDFIQSRYPIHQKSFMIVMAESAHGAGQPVFTSEADPSGRVRYGGVSYTLSRDIMASTGYDARVTVLGHLQRGGTPNAQDRFLGAAFGVHGVDLVLQKKFNRMVAFHQNTVGDVDLATVINQYRALSIDDKMIQTAVKLGIYVGL